MTDLLWNYNKSSKRGKPRDSTLSAGFPFIPKVMTVPRFNKFNVPNIGTYDGAKDPWSTLETSRGETIRPSCAPVAYPSSIKYTYNNAPITGLTCLQKNSLDKHPPSHNEEHFLCHSKTPLWAAWSGTTSLQWGLPMASLRCPKCISTHLWSDKPPRRV